MNVLLVGGLGYVGSVLAEELVEMGIRCDICDSLADPEAESAPKYPHGYQQIDEHQLQEYSTVLWFAGHSSVKKSVEDPDGCIRNNCLDLYAFAKRLNANCRLIYASSASLYSRSYGEMPDNVELSSEDDEIVANNNEYDISKFAFDYVARTFLDNYVGLRMGTVSGFSPRLRRDLIFNAMNLSAMQYGKVEVTNRQAFRSILFLDDLVLLVKSLLRDASEFKGFLNAASLSLSISEIGAAIADYYGAEIVNLNGSGTYSFRMDTGRMRDVVGDAPQTTLPEECEKFERAVLNDE